MLEGFDDARFAECMFARRGRDGVDERVLAYCADLPASAKGFVIQSKDGRAHQVGVDFIHIVVLYLLHRCTLLVGMSDR